LRVAEREALWTALLAFEHDEHPTRIETQYASLTDDQVRDAGLYGGQLRAKREVARKAGEDLDRILAQAPGRVAAIRRWLKRVRLLVGSLLKGVPWSRGAK
jgi:hypothetical protein